MLAHLFLTAAFQLLPPVQGLELAWQLDGNDPHLNLTEIVGIGVTPVGTLLLTQSLSQEVLEVDIDGEVVRRLGRRGQGPGEFQGPTKIFATDESFFVWDIALRRMSEFDYSGNFVQTVPFLGARTGVQYVPVAVTSNGEVIAHNRGLRASGNVAVRERWPLVRFSSEGSRHVGEVAVEHKRILLPLPGGRSATLLGPFNGSSRFATRPGGDGDVAVIDAGAANEVRVTFLKRAGRRSHVVEVAVPNPPVGSEDRRWVVDVWARQLEGLDVPREQLRRLLREHADIPEAFPGVGEAILLADGRLLLRRGPPGWFGESTWNRTGEWYVVTAGGEVSWAFSAPLALRFRAATEENVLLATLLDENGVAHIAGYEMPHPTR